MTKKAQHRTKRTTKAKERPIPFKPTDVSVQPIHGRKTANSVLSTENPEIRRAAERAGTTAPTSYIAPWPGDPTPGRTLLESLKASEWPGNHAEILRRFARDFDETAAELAGAPKGDDSHERAMRHVTHRFGDTLVRACDMLGEELATHEASDGSDDSDGGDTYNVRQALRVLWELRWELGIGTDGKAADYAVKRAVELSAKSASNGAAAEGGAS